MSESIIYNLSLFRRKVTETYHYTSTNSRLPFYNSTRNVKRIEAQIMRRHDAGSPAAVADREAAHEAARRTHVLY